ncbi:T-complex protein 1 subunit delta [Pancytospora philotis]|nr:T-complex protein 1 subunit delta [Pancytospora philotis]
MASERAVKINETIYQATQALLSSLSTSYGPKGLDKMMIKDGKSIVTNDGATILGYYKDHPIHKILSSMCATQDANCGDGTTSVVLLACCLVEQLQKLKGWNVHPSQMVAALEIAKKQGIEYIDSIKIKVDEAEFIDVALTSLSSKIAAKSSKMAEIAVRALQDRRAEDVKILKRVGGNIDDIEMYDGILIVKDVEVPQGSYKALLLQFCLSPPKTNIDSKVLINDYSQMEQFVIEERAYVINLIKAIKKSGANFLVIQKSLLRESCCELAKHFLKKLGIVFIDGVDRKEIEFLAGALGVAPVSDVELIQAPCEIVARSTRGVVEIVGVGCSIVLSGCDEMVLDEAERSLNDVFGVVKSLKAEPYIVPGGGSVETGVAVALEAYTGPHSLIVNEIAKSFFAMPHFLAHNAGIYPVDIVAQLRKNISINRNFGINIRSGLIADMVNDEKIIQPAAVSKSMIVLAAETVQMLVRIDDILPTVQ